MALHQNSKSVEFIARANLMESAYLQEHEHLILIEAPETPEYVEYLERKAKDEQKREDERLRREAIERDAEERVAADERARAPYEEKRRRDEEARRLADEKARSEAAKIAIGNARNSVKTLRSNLAAVQASGPLDGETQSNFDKRVKQLQSDLRETEKDAK